jgi:hypothetical protein
MFRITLLAIAFTTAALPGFAFDPAASLPTADEVIQKAIERGKLENRRGDADRYGSLIRSIEEKLDKSGQIEERTERLSKTVVIDGKPFNRLLEKNGKPLSAKDQKKEAERENKFRERITKPKKDDEDSDVELDEELVSRYQFHIVRKERVGSRPAYVLSFLPKTGVKLPEKKRMDRVLNRLEGMVWIDAEAYSLLKIDMHLTEATSLMGVMASVRKLDFFIEFAEVFPDTFAPTNLRMAVDARVLFSNRNVKQTAVFSEYFPLTPMQAQKD